jgi:hypothetical protein
MGHSEALRFLPQAAPNQLESPPGVLARELLPSLEAVREGVALVRRGTPRASEVLEAVDATLQAMEPIIELLVVGPGVPIDDTEAPRWSGGTP